MKVGSETRMEVWEGGGVPAVPDPVELNAGPAGVDEGMGAAATHSPSGLRPGCRPGPAIVQ